MKTESALTTAATLDPEVALREEIDQTLGADDKNLPRLKEISYSDPENGDITITWAINGHVSQNSTKVNAQIDAANILKVLEDHETRFIYVILIGTYTPSDRDGNPAETQALSLGFNKSKLNMVNWDEFQPLDIFDLADVADIMDEWK